MATANLLTNSLGGHSATLLPNGKVLVAGGAQYGLFTLTSAELYDPATGTWTATGSLTGGALVTLQRCSQMARYWLPEALP